MTQKFLFTGMLMLVVLTGFTQKKVKVYLDNNYASTDSAGASYVREAIIYESKYIVTDKNTQGEILNYGEYSSISPWIYNGLARHYYEPDVIYSKGNYSDNKITGKWLYYDTLGVADTVNYEAANRFNYKLSPEEIERSHRSTDKALKHKHIDSLRKYMVSNFHLPARTRTSTPSIYAQIMAYIDTLGQVRSPIIPGKIDDDAKSELLRLLSLYRNPIPTQEDLCNIKFNFSNEESSSEEEEVFYVCEDMPRFQGKSKEHFQNYIMQNLRYPQEAAENNETGSVFVSFIIEKDGSVSNVKIKKGVSHALNNEAIRVVSSSPKWTPGKQREKAVRVQFTFPISFEMHN